MTEDQVELLHQLKKETGLAFHQIIGDLEAWRLSREDGGNGLWEALADGRFDSPAPSAPRKLGRRKRQSVPVLDFSGNIVAYIKTRQPFFNIGEKFFSRSDRRSF